MAKTSKIIENVTLSEVNETGQLYTWNEPHPTIGKSIWITGSNRAKNVKVGDKGRLEYISTPSYGLWFFKKEEMMLKVDPARVDSEEWVFTGVMVRALGVDGKWGNADIAQLDKESLVAWLRHTNEQVNTLAERTILVLLGHNPHE